MIDLHCHTRFSDGSAQLDDVIRMAALRGVYTLAISDHDTMAGCASAAEIGEKFGVRIIPAAEISSYDEKRKSKVHILCYAPRHPEILRPLLQATLDSRRKGMLEAVDIAASMYPVSREMILRHAEGSTCIYKQHIMHSLMDAGYTGEIFGELFRSLFNSKTGPAYRKVNYPDVFTVLKTVKAAGGKAVLAHPGEYNNLELLDELCARGLLDGVELEHPRNKDTDKAVIREIADRYGIAKTGGTDFHGFYTTTKNPIGTCTTGQIEFDKLFSKGKEF